MNGQSDTHWAVTKILLSWVGGLLGMKLGDWVLLATLVYTVAQTYFLFRDRWAKAKKARDVDPTN